MIVDAWIESLRAEIGAERVKVEDLLSGRVPVMIPLFGAD